MLVTEYVECCARIADEVLSWLHNRLVSSCSNDDFVVIDDSDTVDVLDCSAAVVLSRSDN